MLRKVIFWLAPNEILIPADQVPGSIAESLFPSSPRTDEGVDALSDPNTVPRLKEERRQAKLLRSKIPNLPEDFGFPLRDLNEYLADFGLEAEIQYRRNEPIIDQIKANSAPPQPENYYSYQQTLALLENRLGATDGEIAMWIVQGSLDGGLDAYLHVHEFCEPPQATLDYLALHPCSRDVGRPGYLKALLGMYFKRNEIERFNPKGRYMSYGALQSRWKAKGYIPNKAEFADIVKDKIKQSRLHDLVPGYGFSSLGAGSDSVPPEWAMFAKDEVKSIEAEDFSGVAEARTGDALIGWYDYTLNASMWFGLTSVSPREAAMLICRFNPHDDRSNPMTDSTDETSPPDFKSLLRVFEDVVSDGIQRPLSAWLSIANEKRLRYHSWIKEYSAAIVNRNDSNSSHLSSDGETVTSGAPGRNELDHSERTCNDEPASISWQEKARQIADELFDHDTGLNCRDCLIRKNSRDEVVGGYAYRVMEEMQKRGVHGPRGRFDNARTISREALQGKQWWAKKPK